MRPSEVPSLAWTAMAAKEMANALPSLSEPQENCASLSFVGACAAPGTRMVSLPPIPWGPGTKHDAEEHVRVSSFIVPKTCFAFSSDITAVK